MRKRDLILYNLLFFAAIIATLEIVTFQLTGTHLYSVGESAETNSASLPKCNNTRSIDRPSTNDPQLKALVEYEEVCQSTFASQLMLFTNMPTNEKEAVELADKMTTRLKAFDKFNVQPLVVVEPDSTLGLIDFQEYARGDYDMWIDAYFARLKQNDITSKQLGMWLPFPEPQQDFWNNNSNPDDFANSINRYFKTLRAHFPEGETAILLDSEVGSEKDASQLVAYTRLIEPKLITSVGLQGFPWHPIEEGDVRKPILSADTFAPAYVLEEVAKSLNTKEVFFNTGTYRHRKVSEGGEMAVATAERKATLDSIAKEAKTIKGAGYSVTVNLFAENKLSAKEGVDWSYWQSGQASNASNAMLFTDFSRSLLQNDIQISLYDSRQK